MGAILKFFKLILGGAKAAGGWVMLIPQVIVAIPKLIEYGKQFWKYCNDLAQKRYNKEQHEKMEGAVEKAKQTGDTSDINDMLNNPK